ncbi:hypothetical protein H359_0896 [Chlamydia ibidis 10-1398/6]|nr:hypothetical protein [Chlamydia ibidis]EQM62320.1 hypothetical protein H359_0896 [Chlamydia ibidis 10-1398/6]
MELSRRYKYLLFFLGFSEVLSSPLIALFASSIILSIIIFTLTAYYLGAYKTKIACQLAMLENGQGNTNLQSQLSTILSQQKECQQQLIGKENELQTLKKTTKLHETAQEKWFARARWLEKTNAYLKHINLQLNEVVEEQEIRMVSANIQLEKLSQSIDTINHKREEEKKEITLQWAYLQETLQSLQTELTGKCLELDQARQTIDTLNLKIKEFEQKKEDSQEK